MSTINHVFLTLLIFGLIIWFFENMRNSNQSVEKFHKNAPTIIRCKPLRENDVATDYRIKRSLFEKPVTQCPKPPITIKQFNRDFFNFRDYTNANSSIEMDPVDRIGKITLEGDIGEATTKPNRKVRDIYDDLTKSNINLYQEPCSRLAYFDNTMHDGYNPSFITGMHNVQDNWLYRGESSNNGNIISKENPVMHAYDPRANVNMPALSSL